MQDEILNKIENIYFKYFNILADISDSLREDQMSNQNWIDLSGQEKILSMIQVDLFDLKEDIQEEIINFLERCRQSPIENEKDIKSFKDILRENAEMKLLIEKLKNK